MYTVLAGFQCVLKIIGNRTSKSHFNTLGRVEAEEEEMVVELRVCNMWF